MAVKMTRSWALAISQSVLGAETKRSRKRLAAEFVRDVFTAIRRGRCTDPRFCSDLAIRTWRKVSS
jgi:hypothetical protein